LSNTMALVRVLAQVSAALSPAGPEPMMSTSNIWGRDRSAILIRLQYVAVEVNV